MVKMKKRKFVRQCFWMKKLGEEWRKPRGRQSKLRREKKGRWAVPKIGYGTPAKDEYTIPFGNSRKTPVMVSNLKDLEKINPSTSVGVVSASVGRRKAIEILSKAGEKGIPIKNLRLGKLKAAAPKAAKPAEAKEQKK